jgi:hypothetical protein
MRIINVETFSHARKGAGFARDIKDRIMFPRVAENLASR